MLSTVRSTNTYNCERFDTFELNKIYSHQSCKDGSGKLFKLKISLMICVINLQAVVYQSTCENMYILCQSLKASCELADQLACIGRQANAMSASCLCLETDLLYSSFSGDLCCSSRNGCASFSEVLPKDDNHRFQYARGALGGVTSAGTSRGVTSAGLSAATDIIGGIGVPAEA